MLAWAVLYAILVRVPQKDCSALKCYGIDCSVSCYETTGQSHFVEFDSKDKADRFVENLTPYNHEHVLDKDVPDNKRFIQGLTLHSFKKIHGVWKDITPKE
ncbi:MAG: hypothetical protein ACREBR_04585 [bacterium]